MNHKNIVKTVMTHFLLIIGSFIMVFPFIFMFLTAFKTFPEAIKIPPRWFPEKFIMDNFKYIFSMQNFGVYYMNSIIVTIGRTVAQIILCSMAGFGYARLKFPGKNLIFMILLVALMVPSQMLLIPSFMIVKELGMLDTFAALIIPGSFSIFGTFLLRQAFLQIPDELEDAAKIDGCSYLRMYMQIFVPLIKASISALTVFTVLYSWNDFLFPMVVTSSESMRVLTIAIAQLQTHAGVKINHLMAAGTVATLPPIILFVFLQKYVVQGIALSGIKA